MTRCHMCKGDLEIGCVRVLFPEGVRLVCDLCMEKFDEPRERLTYEEEDDE